MLLIDGEKRFKDRVANILKPGKVTLKPGKSNSIIDSSVSELLGEILLSVATAQELNEMLDRDKFKHYIPREDRKRFLVAFIQAATFIPVFRSREPKATRT